MQNNGFLDAEDGYDKETDRKCVFYKRKASDKIWWVDYPDYDGDLAITFDKKKIYYLFRDYPYAMSLEEQKQFDKENPYWAAFFKERTR